MRKFGRRNALRLHSLMKALDVLGILCAVIMYYQGNTHTHWEIEAALGRNVGKRIPRTGVYQLQQ